VRDAGKSRHLPELAGVRTQPLSSGRRHPRDRGGVVPELQHLLPGVECQLLRVLVCGDPRPNLTILAGQPSTCSTSSLDASFSGYVDFESNIATLVYSPGEVSYSNSSAMTGQILACGGLSDSNSFTLLFNSAAAKEVIGSSGASLS